MGHLREMSLVGFWRFMVVEELNKRMKQNRKKKK
jgi:hypothetical protein